MERFEKDDCYAVMFRFFVIARRGKASTWQSQAFCTRLLA